MTVKSGREIKKLSGKYRWFKDLSARLFLSFFAPLAYVFPMQTAIPPMVRNLALFTGLTDLEKDELLQAGKIRRLGNGDPLFAFGDKVHNFYIICEGAVQLFRETPDGHEMTADVLIAGDTIGEAEIFQSQATYHFNALAVKKTILVEFPVAWLKATLKTHSTLALNLLAMLSRRTQVATVEAEHKSTMSAPQQLACFLERLCILHDFDPKGFDLPYSKTLIASRLGMELETLSRALAKIRSNGITVDGSRVSFDDVAKMESFVCGNCSISGNCSEHEVLRERLDKPEEKKDLSAQDRR